jgi:DNA-binding transcriptional ArsR family regulator
LELIYENQQIFRYNTFMLTNISKESTLPIAELFRLLGQPVRLQVLMTIAEEEACVCHIEAVLHIRQAAISQHLMALRESGLVTAERDGRNIFYRLANPKILAAICEVASSAGVACVECSELAQKPVPGCPCPRCNPGQDPELSCGKIKMQRD